DQFAAALLMPRAWIIRDVSNTQLLDLPRVVLAGTSLYQVSHEAFRLRIAELTPISIFSVLKEDGSIHVEAGKGKKYESPLIPQDLVWKTLVIRTIFRLPESAQPTEYLDPETQLIAVSKLLNHDHSNGRWLVCVLPKAWYERHDLL